MRAAVLLSLLIPGLQSPLQLPSKMEARAVQPGLVEVSTELGLSIEKLRALPEGPKEDPKLVEQAKRATEQRQAEADRVAKLKSDCEAQGGTYKAEGESCNFPPPPKPVYYGNSYTPGQCTWYVASRRSIPATWGNAVSWLAGARAEGFSTGSEPRVGAIAWTSRGYYGHVAYVEAVTADGVVISEMNALNGPYGVDTQTVPAADYYYIY